MSDIAYRHPTIDDLEQVTEVFNKSGSDSENHRDAEPDEIRAWVFEDEDYDPDGLQVALVEGKIVAFGGGEVNTGRVKLGHKEGFISFAVVPEHRGKGIEQHLVEFGIEYLKGKDIELARKWCEGTSGWRHEVMKEFGGEDVRHSYQLKWEKAEKLDSPKMPDGYSVDYSMFKDAPPEEISRYCDIVNECFKDHYAWAPMTLDDLSKWQKTSKDVTRMFFICKEGEYAGCGLYQESTERNMQKSQNNGYYVMLGVKKEHRKKGIGTAMLLDGIHWALDRGLEAMLLAVDTGNPDAVNLYLKLGFEIDVESITYQIDL